MNSYFSILKIPTQSRNIMHISRVMVLLHVSYMLVLVITALALVTMGRRIETSLIPPTTTSSPSPVSSGLSRDSNSLYQVEYKSVFPEFYSDYGFWNPTPVYGGGFPNPAPIPHARPDPKPRKKKQ
ncbi:PREDICTED: uncharacterized protein LOC104823071 [Tarenaya hassleriana]|uniref:uncharacterized protein LOC104823071 n=1 Tax=Tarenaya hassleriana TaxID=28532 RepID=UPI00053C9330|nr:PREDICTED: uncharacterized protein LOC104823071 [Tarenaya hassleriana]